MTPRKLRWVGLALVLGAAGCGDDGIDRDVEDLVTITQGIYGQVTSTNDVGDVETRYLPGFEIDVFPVPPIFPAPDDEHGVPVATTESGARAFYEVALDPGDYVVCTFFGRCIDITVLEGALMRLDYSFSIAPGWFFP